MQIPRTLNPRPPTTASCKTVRPDHSGTLRLIDSTDLSQNVQVYLSSCVCACVCVIVSPTAAKTRCPSLKGPWRCPLELHPLPPATPVCLPFCHSVMSRVSVTFGDWLFSLSLIRWNLTQAAAVSTGSTVRTEQHPAVRLLKEITAVCPLLHTFTVCLLLQSDTAETFYPAYLYVPEI